MQLAQVLEFRDHWREVQDLRQQLAELRRPRTSEQLLFDGLLDLLPKAIAEGKLEIWRRCVYATADLIVSDAGWRNASQEVGWSI